MTHLVPTHTRLYSFVPLRSLHAVPGRRAARPLRWHGRWATDQGTGAARATEVNACQQDAVVVRPQGIDVARSTHREGPPDPVSALFADSFIHSFVRSFDRRRAGHRLHACSMDRSRDGCVGATQCARENAPSQRLMNALFMKRCYVVPDTVTLFLESAECGSC